MANASKAGTRAVVIGLVAVTLLAAAGVGGWFWYRSRTVCPSADMVAVLRANSRGVGHMERFKFRPAVEAFEDVARLAPDWEPGQVNLGIALMTLAKGESVSQQEKDEANRRAAALFEGILARNPKGEFASYAHYCLGLMIYFKGDPDHFEIARQHFKTIAEELDPHDAATWYWLGKTTADTGGDTQDVLACYRRAHDLDPYLNAALQGLHDLLRREGKEEEATALMKRREALDHNRWLSSIDSRYWSDLGRYARVIGFDPQQAPPRTGPVPVFLHDKKLQVRLAPGARWATADDLGTGPVGELRRQVRRRFGAVMVVLDYNRDGKPDLFLLSAVVENGQVRDLLLRNDGLGSFTDVTADAGLAGPRPTLGCCVADFDNDGYPDLLLTGAGQQWLFRNNQHGGFEDVTAAAGLDQLKSVYLGASGVDLDQDGDLDLVIAQLADTPEHALAALKGDHAPGGGVAVFINVSEAPPAARPSEDPPPLKLRFRRDDTLGAKLGDGVPTVGMAVSDVDLDLDLDLVLLQDRKRPVLALNDRLLEFHRDVLPETQLPARPWNGALVIDVNNDQRSGLFFIGPGRDPILLVRRLVHGERDPAKWFEPGATNSPPLLQAQVIDLDQDGWADIVGLSEQRCPVLLHNEGRRLALVPEGLGPDADWPNDLVAVAVADVNCDGRPDLVIWSERDGLQIRVNQGNGNNGLKLELSGHRHIEANGSVVRSNAQAFGTRIAIQAGDLQTSAEFTTLSAGLGQSLQPLMLGLGRYNEPDVFRLRWPDTSIQAEFNSLSPTACHVLRLEQENRKETSCPILFTWNGERFGFVTDFLGAGSLGEPLAGGGHRQPRAEESIKIEAGQLKPRDGKYVLKIAEPMDEVTYLDRLQLLVLDQPPGVRTYPDERFADPPPSQDLLAFREEIHPLRATDHRGRDVTGKLCTWDRDTASGFAWRAWIGFAEEHWVELDFGDRLARLGPNDPMVLCLAGWTDYPYPESLWAARQAGVELLAPVLERLVPDGRWQAIAEVGFPAGLPRMMTLDLTGKLGGPRCLLRLRTNMQVHWDQIFIAPIAERTPRDVASAGGKRNGLVRVTPLEVYAATLAPRGCMQEHSPDGRLPTVYDYDRVRGLPVNRLQGQLTRFGDVTALLRAADDCFVLFGPGDELTAEFNARTLPPLPQGWMRSFVLRTWGYCKDCAPFTATGDTVEPLPFRGMSRYPYGPDEHYPRDPLHDEYRRKYNTRLVGPVLPRR